MEKDWSELANNFDELQRYVTGEAIDKIIKEQLSGLTDLGNLIEFGCGIGTYTKTLSKLSNYILATDISDDMIRIAKEKLKDFSNIEVQKENCYHTDLKEKSYDSVFMANLIHVVKEPEKVMNESYRLLKDGGKLIILSFTKDGMSFFNKTKLIARYLKAFGKPPTGGTQFTLKKLEEFILNHGFSIESSKLLGKEESKVMFIVAIKK